MKNEVEMHRIEAIQIRRVNGSSKSNSFRPRYLFLEISWLMKYDTPDIKSMRKRMAKIQTIRIAWTFSLGTARQMKEMSATPVTP